MAPLDNDYQMVNGDYLPDEDRMMPSSPVSTILVTGGAGFM